MMEKWREEKGENHSLCPFPPQIQGRSPGSKELTGTKKKRRKSSGSETGKPEKGRKEEIPGGGRDQERKSLENGKLQEAPALTICCWGCHCQQGGQGHLLGPPRPVSSA